MTLRAKVKSHTFPDGWHTNYDGYTITQQNYRTKRIFKVEGKAFETLRDAMDYVDTKWDARGNNNLVDSTSSVDSKPVVRQSVDKQPSDRLEANNPSDVSCVPHRRINK